MCQPPTTCGLTSRRAPRWFKPSSPTGLTTWSAGVLTIAIRLSACTVFFGGVPGAYLIGPGAPSMVSGATGATPESTGSPLKGGVPTAPSAAVRGVPLYALGVFNRRASDSKSPATLVENSHQ